MRLFRRSLPIDQAVARPASAEDLAAVEQLFRQGGRRFFGFSPNDLPSLLATMPAALLSANDSIWGVMLSGWRSREATWLRGFALVDGIAVSDGVAALLPLYIQLLRDAGLHRVYYAGDEATDRWLQPALQGQGFQLDTEVVVYEKRDPSVPWAGDATVRLRDAQLADLPGVLAVDERCFDDQWTKGGEILGPALDGTPFFIVAELDGVICGYALATTHYNNHLIHLVRIAVDPLVRGRGVGVRMLAELVDFALRCQAEVITLNTQADNYQAQRLYEWFNFRLSGERQPILRFDVS